MLRRFWREQVADEVKDYWPWHVVSAVLTLIGFGLLAWASILVFWVWR